MDEVEHYLRAVVEREPQEGECLACFVHRMLDEFRCDSTLLWATRFRDLRSPTATGLRKRMGSMGAFCDCKLFLNGYQLVQELMVRDLHTDELELPAVRPVCAGVRRTNTRPCANWERVRRRS